MNPMNREEFLEILNIQLQGEIPSNEISHHLAYYHNFINQKIRQGQSEAEVLEELGDPRLIAKTLIDTEHVPNIPGYRQDYAYSAEEAKPKDNDAEEPVYKTDNNRQTPPRWEKSEKSRQADFQQDPTPQTPPNPDLQHWLDTSTWQGKLVVITVSLLLCVLLIIIIGALLPALAALAVIAVIVSLIRRFL